MPQAKRRGGCAVALRQLLEVSGRTPEISWRVILLEEGPLVADIAGLGVDTSVVPAGRVRHLYRFASTVLRVSSIVRRDGADALVSWMAKGQLYGGPSAVLAGVPSLWYQWGIPSDSSWLDRVATALPAQGVVACSRIAADTQGRLRPRRRVQVVHPGVELQRFDPEALPSPREARQCLGLPVEGPIVGIVGRLQRWKGMHVLVEAMPAIVHAYPGAHCVVVGELHSREPDYLSALETAVETLRLDGHVTIACHHNDPALIPQWMQAMDVVVHASDNEPFGMVVIEAMALAKPVVAGANGGPTEIISDGIDGLLVPYGDAVALARAVLRFLDQPDFAGRVAVAARARARRFSTETFATEVVAAIRDLTAQPGRVRSSWWAG